MSDIVPAWPEALDTSLLAHQFGVTDQSLEEDWRPYRRSDDTESDTSETSVGTILIPDAIRSNWYLLFQSHLPERAFDELVMAASAQERMLDGPMKPLSSTSLRGFLMLWEAVRDHSSEPVLSISPTGDVISEWFGEPDNSLVVMSNRNGKLLYSLFDQGEPCEGTARTDRVGDLVAMFLARETNPFSWSDANEG